MSRRRKVRCNEHKPRCSHCERLNLECTWRPSLQQRQTPASLRLSQSAGINASNGPPTPSSISAVSTLQDPRYPTNDNSFNDIFNYASFMWDPNLQEHMIQPKGWRPLGVPEMEIDHGNSIEWPSMEGSNSMLVSPFSSTRQDIPTNWNSTAENHISPSNSAGANIDSSAALMSLDNAGEKELMDYFIRSVVPPIIAQVETQLKWSSMRQLFISMSATSPMVRYAVLAFSELLMRRERGVPPQYEQYYQMGAAEVQRYSTGQSPGNDGMSATTFECVLATLFLLSYIDLLECGTRNAHAHLKQAYDVSSKADKSQFRVVGKRLVSWIRLLDARAVSAGGEGLFLQGNDNDHIDQSSPATSIEVAEGGSTDNAEADIEDVLFDALYEPGFLFFQKIQIFMGRISHIDPWHRSRGTVADETEVMGLAAKIGRDLISLWEQRPPLMDCTLNGKLTSAHLSPSLASAITRTFRTYYANYHACKIHLHRVAYKHLPLSTETEASVENIRNTARIIVEGSLEQEPLPVSMLWPLLMWGSEENDPETQGWIYIQINRMEKVATNAEITGQVLREVQARQENLKQRVDIRTVMQDIFNSCFAIV
ncbi:uncharacterized protein BP5553_08457 [Venustampulla echinocandica]|uniref:Zn(2)-C6 fungal-type domain-containing protein n=1 Tax=Venustampulla echinocandica TaxID=2656787 RepID=A0A370TEA3_9HELO|nr:uncharacterized protein BP5553_08457 [Venustampulla echinocandica]RDL33018.1 hypothetical protein BP5553_08457 [Venustampulla echinocandica]